MNITVTEALLPVLSEIDAKQAQAALDFGTRKITFAQMQDVFDQCDYERLEAHTNFIADNGIFDQVCPKSFGYQSN